MLSEFVLTFKLSVFYFPLQCLRVPIVCKGGEGGGHYDNDSRDAAVCRTSGTTTYSGATHRHEFVCEPLLPSTG